MDGRLKKGLIFFSVHPVIPRYTATRGLCISTLPFFSPICAFIRMAGIVRGSVGGACISNFSFFSLFLRSLLSGMEGGGESLNQVYAIAMVTHCRGGEICLYYLCEGGNALKCFRTRRCFLEYGFKKKATFQLHSPDSASCPPL